MPAFNSSAIASKIPEPQIPAGFISLMVRTDGMQVLESINTLSMAPGAALIPYLTCAPSNAGPDAVETLVIFFPLFNTISVLVPISIPR
ncbi:hypothetical protein ES708_30125 [subsurface metagenome]